MWTPHNTIQLCFTDARRLLLGRDEVDQTNGFPSAAPAMIFSACSLMRPKVLLRLQHKLPGHFTALHGLDTPLPQLGIFLTKMWDLVFPNTPPGVQLKSCQVVPKADIHINTDTDRKTAHLGPVCFQFLDYWWLHRLENRAFCLLFCNTRTDYPHLNYSLNNTLKSKGEEKRLSVEACHLLILALLVA